MKNLLVVLMGIVTIVLLTACMSSEEVSVDSTPESNVSSEPKPESSSDNSISSALTFTLSSNSVAAGENVTVTFSQPLAPLSNERYWITIADATTGDDEWGDWVYGEADMSRITLTAPDTAGSYEVRLHGNYPTKPYNVIHRLSLTIN